MSNLITQKVKRFKDKIFLIKMSYKCNFCKKSYSTKGSLTNHQKTAKYCIKIQQQNLTESIDTETDIIENISFVCKFCEKDFSSNHRYQKHLDICLLKHKHIIKNKDCEIEMMKEKICFLEKSVEEQTQQMKTIRLEIENEFYKQREKRSTNIVEEIAKQPRIQTNNNQKVLITTPMDMSQLSVMKAIQSGFSEDYLVQGQKGVARFAYDNILKDEQGKLKYICTDAARQIFQFKDEDGSIQKDVRATKLTKALLDGEIKSASHKIACKKMACGGDEEFDSYTNNYYEIKDMEEDNSEFSKELSTLVT